MSELPGHVNALLLTRGNTAKFLLHALDYVLHFLSRTPPEYEAVSGVFISWFNRWVVELSQDRIDSWTSEAFVQYFCFLLGVSCRTMLCVSFL